MAGSLIFEDANSFLNDKKENTMAKCMQLLHQRSESPKDEVTAIRKDQIRIALAVYHDIGEVWTKVAKIS